MECAAVLIWRGGVSTSGALGTIVVFYGSAVCDDIRTSTASVKLTTVLIFRGGISTSGALGTDAVHSSSTIARNDCAFRTV